MNIWKLGCNWGKGQSFFDDFIKNEKIVLGWEAHDYDIGDIVLIARGFTIVALAKVVGIKTQITENKEYEKQCKKYNIDYCDEVYYAPVEWVDLKKNEYFQYKLRQGIRQVRSTEVQNKAKSLYQKYKNDQKHFFLIPLNQIANWEAGTPNENGILAEVPILQRGLVWEQSQIELLWDSILRGIPIGSLVLCRITDDLRESQSKRKIKDTSHFIIDGQQRCNAITLGFSAFPPKDENSSIIWLDLNATKLSGTREFLVRLTTLAHPWGFNKSDDAGRLSVSTIRDKTEELKGKGKEIDFANLRRFKPSEIFPFDADCPIPLSILLNADDENFWRNVKTDLQRFVSNGFQWAERVLQFIDKEHFDKEKIQRAIYCAKNTKIIALNMPDFLMEPTDRERSSEINDGITNIEHLFQRLNRQGTTLDGEELVYSMIKSYFPEIADEIDKVANGRMPSSKLVQLSIRLALSDDKGLRSAFNVTQIRRIASSNDETEKGKISHFIFHDLQSIASTVDLWLTNDNQTWGLPKVLKTGIAMSSPDVYCLLFFLAWKYPKIEMETYKRITGIALFLHWFIDDKDKGRAVSSIYKFIYNADGQTILSQLISSLNKDEYIKGFLQRIQNPAIIAQIIDFKEDNLSSWEWIFCKKTFQDLMKGEESTEIEKKGINLEYEKYIAPLLGRLIGNRELLLYAQRDYLRKRFPDYDPARKDLWKLINRPWDFDHILPKAFVKGKWDTNLYKKFCDNWINSNGNLRAWPFIDNRSDQSTATIEKMKNDESWKDSFIDDNERLGYGGQNVVSQPDVAFKFALSCKNRIIRMYEEWYNNFNISELKIED